MHYSLVFVFLFIQKCSAQTNDTSVIVTHNNETNNASSTVEDSPKAENKSIEMERIVKPVQHRQSETIVEPISSYSNVSTKLEKINGKSINNHDFRPSPQLDLEPYNDNYNRYPVPPALPEAKHISSLNIGEYNNNNYRQEYRPDTSVKWPNSNSPQPPHPLTTEHPWTTRVKFPTTPQQHTARETHHHHYLPPYKDYSTGTSGRDNNYGKYGPSSGGGPNVVQARPHNKHWLDKPDYKPPPTYPTSSNGHTSGSAGGWDDYERNRPGYDTRRPPILHKTHYEYGGYERPSYIEPTGGSKFDYGESSPPSSVSPWKKIIKILTAFIPIGLLISALTPTVITVTPMNNTQMRYRTEDPKREAAKRLISSLTYFNNLNGERCEDRILCELLLSASSSKNAEQHVRNLLNNFTEQDKNGPDRTEDMKKIFEAVKEEDCTPIECDTIKGAPS